MIRFLLFLIVALGTALTYALVRLQSLRSEMEKNKVPVDEEGEEQKKSVIRHDLKGTLNRIFALTRLIPMSGPVNEAQQEYLTKIEAQCKEGQEAINRAIPKGQSPPSS